MNHKINVLIVDNIEYEMLSTEPYEVSGRLYVRVRHPKTRNERQVRWYSDKEYAKLYPEIPVVNEVESIYTRPQKDVLGFEKGYITIFKGDTYAVVDWFRERPECRFHTYWGWYVISTEEVPTLPAGIEAVQLRWEDVSYEGEDALKSESAVKDHLRLHQTVQCIRRFQDFFRACAHAQLACGAMVCEVSDTQ